MSSFGIAVGASADDGIENASTHSVTRTGNLEVSSTYSHAAMRFAGAPAARGSRVLSAWLDVVVNNSTNDIPDMDIGLWAVDNAGALAGTGSEISGMTLTAAKGQWSVASPGTGSGAQSSPDFAAALEEVFARPGWESGNAVMVVCVNRGGSVFRWNSWDTGTAPVLNAVYEEPGGTRKVMGVRLASLVGGGLAF